MSRETMEDLNTNTLIGFTEKRGNAWHYREGLQGSEPNHYPGAIPVEDVARRLFDWTIIEVPLAVNAKIGKQTASIDSSKYKALVRSDTRELLHIPGADYAVHEYKEWLLERVATILDDDLQIGSAGLLQGGRMAWVQVEMAETQVVEGYAYRPFLTASSSHDGTISNRLQRNVQAVVCDNTLACARGESGQAFAIRHTKNSVSNANVAAAREALNVIMTAGKDFEDEVKRLTSEKVSAPRFTKWVEAMTDLAKAKDKGGRSLTMAENKIGTLRTLYNDERVSQWAGTAFGVLQTWNTFVHHEQSVRGQSRVDANAMRVARGYVAKEDDLALKVLARV